MTRIRCTLLLAALAFVGCGAATAVRGVAAANSAPRLADARFVDLTYSFGPDTIYWPTDRHGFELDIVARGASDGGYWYEANRICTAEHGGTHMDAPVHFAEGQLSTDRVPVEAGIGPLTRIDVRGAADRDPDYRLSARDIVAWEKRYGRIPRGAIVVMYSGWGERWPDAARYLGTDRAGDTENLHFPGFGEDAVRFLLRERDIKAIGVDTASIDHGPSRDFIVHQILHGAGKPAFENLANLDQIPPNGATLIALPMKIANGSGGPLRAIAVLP